jgi:recombination protein RecA
MAKKDKLSLDDVIKNINKRAGNDIAGYGIPKREYTSIPFTSPRMNYCTYGGVPTGRIIEFYGEEHGGKTTSALDLVANYQQMQSALPESERKKVAYLDSEITLDVQWAEKLGVNVDDLILLQPEEESAEDLLQMILDLLETGQVGLAVIDSIAAMVSAQAMDKTVADKTYAGISMPLTTFGNKAVMLCKKYNATVIGINQIRDDLGAMYSGAIKTPGGRGWKHLCSVRMQFTRGSFIDDKGAEIKRSSESPAGNKVLMTMTKNKTCPANRRGGYYTIRYDSGIDYLADLVEVAIKYDMIQQAGAWFTIINPDTGEVKAEKIQGMSRVYDFLADEENESILQFIEDYVDSKI